MILPLHSEQHIVDFGYSDSEYIDILWGVKVPQWRIFNSDFIGFSDNLIKNSLLPPLSLYPISTLYVSDWKLLFNAAFTPFWVRRTVKNL